jgi:uncharacterized protein YcbK (DUF882 family)
MLEGNQFKFFTRSEFACKCGCGFAAVDAELLSILQNLREHFSTPVVINSACRCPSHNAKVGGEPNSQHMFGLAVDIVVRGVSPAKVAQYLNGKYENKYGIGEYLTWTHIDVREKKARWKK